MDNVKVDAMKKIQGKQKTAKKTVRIRIPDHMFADSVLRKAKKK
jgi:hypothetical protein